MTSFKPGDKVTYFSYEPKGSWSIQSATKYQATIIRVNKQRVTIEMPDGKKISVEPYNLELVPCQR